MLTIANPPGPPAVRLQSQQVCGRCCQHGPPASGLPRNRRQDPVCGLQLCRQHHHPVSAAGQTLPAAAVEMVVDFWRNRVPPSPITLCDSPVTTVDSFRFLGSIITQDLKWELNISSITMKAQQRLFFLRQLKKFNLPKTMMVHFYTAIIESILCSSITVWYAAATAKDKGRLQRVIRSAERAIGCNLPSLQDLFASRSLKRAKKMVADPSHPGQKLFVPLPSGRRLRSIRTTTSRHTNSFFPSAVGLINRAGPPLTDSDFLFSTFIFLI
uniref:Alkylated DNA repair protein AlkB homologue 8 N-terminal domain-containing protein n=1 Tax=Gasterosteus aculeatus aculeatus TaxID=481459 RepID=A0AAQ4QMI9_GASAC